MAWKRRRKTLWRPLAWMAGGELHRPMYFIPTVEEALARAVVLTQQAATLPSCGDKLLTRDRYSRQEIGITVRRLNTG